LGIVTGGGVAVCIDIEQPDEIVREMIRLADCEAVFASSALVPVVRSLVEQGEVRELFSLDRGQASVPGFEEFCSRAPEGKNFPATLKGNNLRLLFTPRARLRFQNRSSSATGRS
jgi:hypothetical protein